MRDLALASRGGQVAFPYCALDGEGLVRLPPASYPDWPLKRHSAAVALLEAASAEIRSLPRSWHRRHVTELLLEELQDTATSGGARFAVVLLESAPEARRRYAKFRSEREIPFMDCTHPIHPAGWPRVVTHPRLPQIRTCRFPASGSSV